ncbi:MAG: (d)CMP kinase [Candidatus Omnitrophota bacterium]
MIIAIDGPAGAGKSTVAKEIAQKLGFLYIDTGAMYRALTLKILQAQIDIGDIAKISKVASHTEIVLTKDEGGSLRVLLDGQDVSRQIREARITQFVSDIAKIKEVRHVMVGLQRDFGAKGDCVLDGRDIGTVVFPGADKKFYIDADLNERVRRRFNELKELGQNIIMRDVEHDLRNRDMIDSTRKVAPLKRAEDAVYVDTTRMTIEEVVDHLLGNIKNPNVKIQNPK